MYLEWLLVAGRFPAIGARVFPRGRIGSYSVAVVNTALFSRLRNHPALSLKVTVASTTTRVFSRAPIRPRRSSSITGSRLNYRRRPQPFSRFVAFFRSRVVCSVSSFFDRDAVFLHCDDAYRRNSASSLLRALALCLHRGLVRGTGDARQAGRCAATVESCGARPGSPRMSCREGFLFRRTGRWSHGREGCRRTLR